MVKNNIEKDIKIMLIDKGLTQESLGEKMGTTGQYVNRVLKKNKVVNETFIKMLDALGYDIELTYVPKK